MNRTTTILLLLFLLSAFAGAQERIDPRHPDAQPFPEFGRMIGLIDTSKGQVGDAERFGYRLWPLGDVDHDGLADWVVGHYRVDSIQQFESIPIIPQEMLLYKGVRGKLPPVESGRRVGPTELFCQTDLLGIGDFDADGSRDIVMRAQFYGDTSFNNHDGKALTYVIVYWGNDSGNYSNDDTTRLASSANTWLGRGNGIAGDITGDQVDDLALYFPASQAQGWGATVTAPRLHLFAGHSGGRWGRAGISSGADLRWWSSRYNPSDEITLSILDHDRDGANDLAILDQNVGTDSRTSSRISVLYGRSGRQMLDTTDFEQIILTVAGGKFTGFIDVTGDSVAEMIVDCGIDVNKYKIFAGRKGQRLAAQYGTGNDQPIAGQGWWNRPWLEVLLPHSINDGWYPNFRFSVADLGDGNLDGIRDIWTYSEPYLICYTTGEYLDQWVDGYFYLGGVWAVANLGDIDGSGKQTIALHYHRTPQPFTPFPGGIVFIKPNRELPRQYGGDPPLRLPHEEASVRGAPGTDDISFTLTRDRGSHRQMLALTNGTPGAQYTVQIVNQLGERIALYRLSAEQSHIDIDLPRGIYFVSIASRSGIRTHPLLVE